MSEFQTSTLDDMCDLIIDCPHFTPEWTTEGFVVIRNQNIRHGKLDLSDQSFTHKEDFERRIKRAKPRAGDIIFTREAPMGEVCLIPKGLECCLGQRQVLLRPKVDISGQYLFFALQSPYVRHQIFWNEGTGSTVSNVRIPVLKALRIPRQLNEEAIARILSSLDDKIELNRRMNETLEAMARAIFKDWFVDFGPTRAKQEGRAAYLPEHLWSLFPGAIDPETGLPQGWELTALGSIAESVNRTVNPTEIDEKTPYIGLEHMPRHSIALSEWEGAGKVTSNKLGFETGEFLFGKLRPYFHKVGIAPLSGICSTDIVVVRAKSEIWSSFVLMAISTNNFVEYTNSTSTGTKMPRTSWSIMAKYELPLPTEHLVKHFNLMIKPCTSQITSNIHLDHTLAALRDRLLPKLMSGEIRVRDAEKLVEEAV